MNLQARVSRVVAFLRAGCPPLAPATGYAPLLALLPRRVADDEVMAIARKLVAPQHRPVDSADVGVEIIRVTGEAPSTYDIERVLGAMKSAGDRPC
ncbi:MULTISPECIES: DUF3349 domain-containing protein [Mycobacterium]|uniref:DUF3349 domain-containing protein n=1 Tax=Mycobacterium TaxID=1763 RepID=UPI00025D593E|nr:MULTISPECIES: DUF3349 domain-containing protein [Mycobacterium]AFJ36874.1 hypothetical protein W7S_19605 [Mycobacterium sp. MOTT36Y]ASX01867.1 DUF3349 domain-containing protein [Mycobacterium intracellulare subsp. chimaera]ELR82460.1 hypothetical protein W7U_15605 [Mycobacterium sp. H4Y]KEF99637.1 hypothetical protein K883_00596 [Mycobacterium sp. TKK-01-0059]PBA56932.1 DUF3349 domain-containing protein [Mycobacterium intracellulare subsp. chimaera]